MNTNQLESILLRDCHEADYESLYELWRIVGLTLGLSDTITEFRKLLAHNPSLCLVATCEKSIIGCVLGGFDGRRGLVHHLAVDPKWQGRGIGGKLMGELESRFRELNVVKLNFWVEADNMSVVDFYVNLGYERRDLITVSKTLR